MATRLTEGLELLLAVGDTVEKVHQSVWYALLTHSPLLSALGISSSTTRKVEWEPAGGTFDLKVVTDDDPVWIELKVDSELGEDQLRKQFEHAKEGLVVYALLGFTDIRSRPRIHGLTTTTPGVKLLGPAEVADALREVAKSSTTMPAAKQLADAYAGQLDEIRGRGADFRTTPSWQSAHSLTLFDRLRRESKPMHEAIAVYVANQSGGFEACYWGWIHVGGGVECYLQWELSNERRRLCFKISVQNQDARGTVRAAAVAFLEDRPLSPSTKVRRPTRLGSGHTMTVGYLEELPVQDADGAWEDLLTAVSLATQMNQALGAELQTAMGLAPVGSGPAGSEQSE